MIIIITFGCDSHSLKKKISKKFQINLKLTFMSFRRDLIRKKINQTF